jgi:hypothetical protein
MPNVDVKTGPYATAPAREGAKEQNNRPDAVRVRKLEAAEGVVYLALSNTYPDVLVPDTIGEALTGDAADRDAGARIASTPAAHAMIQSAVEMQQAGETN